MRKILLFTLEYPPDTGGIATYLARMHEKLPHCSVVRPRFWRMWPHWLPAVWQGIREIRTKKIEVVSVSHVLPMGIVAMLCRFFTGVPYIVFFHGLDLLRASKHPWKRMLLRLVVRQSETVVANSEFTAQLIRKTIEPCSLIIITPCIEQLPEISTVQQKSESFVLLSVSRLVSRKNHALVVAALDMLRKEIPALRYIIIGDGPERLPLEQMATARGLTDRIEFLGIVDDTIRETWYRRADIFILPTVSCGDDVEGFGIVFLEAASYGLPVIGGCGGGVEEVVEHGVTGMLIDPSSVSDCAEVIRKIFYDAEARKYMGEAGRNRIRERFLCSNRKTMIQKLYAKRP